MQHPDSEILFPPYSSFTRDLWNNRDSLRLLIKPRNLTNKPANKKKKATGKVTKKPAGKTNEVTKKPAGKTNGKA